MDASSSHAKWSLRRGRNVAVVPDNERKHPSSAPFSDDVPDDVPDVDVVEPYPAIEDFRLDIIIDQGPKARTIRLDLPPFTLVGATTRAGKLTSPMRSRFGIPNRLDYYTTEEIEYILMRSARLHGVPIEKEGAHEIARRSRGTPRIANRLLRRVRDYADVKGDGTIHKAIAQKALVMLDVDPEGFDLMDRKLLEAVIHRFDGGPVGLDNIAASIGEERDTIEDVIEPYLIQQGYLQRTPRGRMATLAAFKHLGVMPPKSFGERF